MLKFMRKIPAGTLLVPMLISALVNTIAPGFLASFGGITSAFLTGEGTNYIIGLVCFCSATLLDINTIKKVMKKQGVLALTKIISCIVLSFLFIQLFGMSGILGISAIAFTVAICSTNPSLYMTLVGDYGTEDDVAAFGIISLLCVPAFPLFVFSLTQGGAIDWTPIISTLIPILLGAILGNLDKEMGSFFGSMLGPLTPFMGWSFGASINLVNAIKAGPTGILLTVIFYIAQLPILLLVEKKVLKEDGISSIAMTSIAGLSVSIPNIIAANNPELAPLAASATAQIAFGVVLSSAFTPFLAQRYAKANNIEKNIKAV